MKVPTFSAKSKLVRYVNEINRLSGNRPAVATFLPDPPSANPANDHLSVNSLEVETMKEIAAYHRWKWQNNRGVLLSACTRFMTTATQARKAEFKLPTTNHRPSGCLQPMEQNLKKHIGTGRCIFTTILLVRRHIQASSLRAR